MSQQLCLHFKNSFSVRSTVASNSDFCALFWPMMMMMMSEEPGGGDRLQRRVIPKHSYAVWLLANRAKYVMKFIIFSSGIVGREAVGGSPVATGTKSDSEAPLQSVTSTTASPTLATDSHLRLAAFFNEPSTTMAAMLHTTRHSSLGCIQTKKESSKQVLAWVGKLTSLSS